MSACENHAEVNDKRKMHSETEDFIDILQDNNLLAEFSSCNPENARARCEAISVVCAGDLTFEGKCSEYVLPSSTCREGIPITVYTPPVLGMKPAIVVYFHGVGMMWGTRSTGNQICRHTSQRGCCIVVNVEYRTTPEHNLAAAIDDAVCAVRWVIFNKGLLGAKHDSNVGVMGESGGGLVAAQVAQEIAQVSFQILVYPKLDLNTDSSSYTQSINNGPLCTVTDVRRFAKDASECMSDKELERCTPGSRANCCNVPPAMFVIAEYDPTKDDAHNYIKKLKECTVKTSTVTVKGTYHGFFHLPGHFKSCCEKAMSRVSDLIKSYSDYNHLQLLK